MWNAKTITVICLTVLSMSIGAGRAQAAIVTFDFTGVVTRIDVNNGLFGPAGTVSIGDLFSGSFSYQTGPSNPDQQAADTALGVYNSISFSIDQSLIIFDSNAIAVQHLNQVVLPPSIPDAFDRFSLFASTTVSGYSRGPELFLEGPFGAVFSSDNLPETLNLADFTSLAAIAAGGVGLGVPASADAGDLLSLTMVSVTADVPLPPAAFLFAGGLALLARRRRAL